MGVERPGVVAGPAASESRSIDPAPRVAWRWLGWLGLALTLAGGTDVLLGWWPPDLGVREWRFATIHQTLTGLPLVTLGLTAVLASGAALGIRKVILVVAAAMLLAGVLVLAALGAFLLDVPLALEAATGPAVVGVRRLIGKTIVLGGVLGSFLVVTGWSGLRNSSGPG